MKHINTISQNKPARAQFESFLQAIGLASSIIGLVNSINNYFAKSLGIKEDESEE